MNQTDIVYEEDVEVALTKCIEVLGPIGRYVEGGSCKTLYTKEYGKLWYGDLDAEDVEFRIPALAKVIGVEEITLL